jgi:CBS-domain-containing membrane protein
VPAYGAFAVGSERHVVRTAPSRLGDFRGHDWGTGQMIKDYISKMTGGARSSSEVKLVDVFWSWLGSAVGIGICGFLSSRYFEPRDATLLIGSFGASAVLVHGAIQSPFSQSRNVIGGHIISALVGVASLHLLGVTPWAAASLGLSLAIAAMLVTGTVHPPGGATALIAVIGGDKVHALGVLYALVPGGLGALILVVVAVLINNLSRHRKYPHHWF